MSLTQEQAFRAGFLMRCAEEGLSKEETRQRVKQALADCKSTGKPLKGMSKEAAWPLLLTGLGAAVGGALSAGGRIIGALPSAASTAGMLALGIPVVAGAGTGYLASKMFGGGDPQAFERVKQDELIDEYDRLAEEARRRARLKKLQAETGRRIIPLAPSV